MTLKSRFVCGGESIESMLKCLVLPVALVPISLFPLRSRIIHQNGGVVYAARYCGLKGLFRKDVEHTLVFGRKVCDLVKFNMGNAGFFTSDELPRYGISFAEKEFIMNSMGATKDDLVVLFAYEYGEALRTKECFEFILLNLD